MARVQEIEDKIEANESQELDLLAPVGIEHESTIAVETSTPSEEK